MTCGALLAWALARGAHGQVLEVGEDGAARWLQGPAVYTSEGVSMLDAGTAPRSAPTGARQIRDELRAAAAREGLDDKLVLAVAVRESGLRQSARSEKDAVGVMQLTAAAAQDVGVDRFDVRQNIYGGAAYLRRMIEAFGGDLRLALAAYNAGPAAVRRYRGVPPYAETRAYVAAVLAHYQAATMSIGEQHD